MITKLDKLEGRKDYYSGKITRLDIIKKGLLGRNDSRQEGILGRKD